MRDKKQERKSVVAQRLAREFLEGKLKELEDNPDPNASFTLDLSDTMEKRAFLEMIRMSEEESKNELNNSLTDKTKRPARKWRRR